MISIEEIFESDPFSWWLPYIVAVIVGIITCIREYTNGPECPSNNFLTNKIILITGGSGGIASNVATELAKRGGIIILACKNISKGEQVKKEILKNVPNSSINVKYIDLSSFDSIRNFTQKELQDKKISVLINNAGVKSNIYQTNEEGFESHFATNYLGHFYFIHLLILNAKMIPNARIINIVDNISMLRNMSTQCLNFKAVWKPDEAYIHSKVCLKLMTSYMANVLLNNKITINDVYPGNVRGTELNRTHTKNSWFNTCATPYHWLFYKNPKKAAQSIIYVAVDDQFNKISGKLIKNCEIQQVAEKESAQEHKLQKDFYLHTCEVLKLSPLE